MTITYYIHVHWNASFKIVQCKWISGLLYVANRTCSELANEIRGHLDKDNVISYGIEEKHATAGKCTCIKWGKIPIIMHTSIAEHWTFFILYSTDPPNNKLTNSWLNVVFTINSTICIAFWGISDKWCNILDIIFIHYIQQKHENIFCM